MSIAVVRVSSIRWLAEKRRVREAPIGYGWPVWAASHIARKESAMVVERGSNDVLVVDDDAQIAAVIADLLESEGYGVRTGVDGGALSTALADPPGLVLLDLMMPVMDGTEVCRRLNSDARTKHVPIVVLTALPPDVAARRLTGCDYRRIIRKPFSLTEILDTVARHLA